MSNLTKYMWNQQPGNNQGQGQWGNNQPNQWGSNNNNQPNQWGQNQPNQWGNNNTQPNIPNPFGQQNQGQGNQWGQQNQGQGQGWGQQNQGQGGWGQQNQGQGWGQQNQGFGQNPNQNPQWAKNAFYNPNQNWGNGFAQKPQWFNPNNSYIPPINFQPGCKKCHGSGSITKHGNMIPCRLCYKRNQICPKCYGSGINYFKNKPCKCQGGRWGKRKGHRSSSSSSS